MKMSLRTVLLTAGASLLVSNPAALAHTDVTALQARELIDSTSDLIVVDVRERYEYCSVRGHIPGALNYPWRSGVLQTRYHELPVDAPILVVCGSGGRSNSSAGFLDENGFSTVYDMLGGMSAWQWETAPCTYSGGSGTSEDPYQIATADDLMLLAESPDDYDKHFILTADIDLDPNLPGRRVFGKAVIAPDTDTAEPGFQGTPFTGIFDGNGHTISRLTITGTSYLGLCGQLNSEARISNMALEAVDVNGTGDYVGGLVGQSISGTITACRSTGTVTGSGKYVGGLVGSTKIGIIMDCRSTGTVTGGGRFVGGLVGSSGGSIATSCSVGLVSGADPVGGLVGTNLGDVVHCYSAAEVRGNETVGGLVGFSVGPALSDCYSIGAVTGDDKVGGLVGSNFFTDVTRCYSTGAVTGNSQVGGLVGMNISLPGELATGSFWDIRTSGQTGSAGSAIGKTTAEMQTAATFLKAGWDFADETANGPNDIWKISEGLDYPRLWWEKYGGGTGEPNDPFLIYTAEHLNAIGPEPNDYDKHFKLMADIDSSEYSYDKAVIAPDINDVDSGFQGIPFTGVFDGNSHTISNLSYISKGKNYVALFGYVSGHNAEIKHLGLIDPYVSAQQDALSAGSLTGELLHGTITNCYVEGCNISGEDFVGGLVGGNNHGTIRNCYAIGTVSGFEYLGGLAGVNSGWITNSYAAVSVTGNNTIGGLVGYNAGFRESVGTILQCYSIGILIGDSEVGGLVGGHPGIVMDSFWDIETSSQTESASGEGRTTGEMQMASTFLEASWDFVDETDNGTEDIWWILEGQDYPRLWWETGN